MPEAESKSENDESLQFFCRPCKLLFIDADGLAAHHHTESHGFVSTGVHPPGGSHSCIVCWVGFQVKYFHKFSAYVSLIFFTAHVFY